MRAWLVVLERRGVFIWPLRVVVHVAALLPVGWLVSLGAHERDFVVTACMGILLGGLTTTLTSHVHVFGLMILEALEQSARAALEDLRQEVRRVEMGEEAAAAQAGALSVFEQDGEGVR
jgi:hypothetical protein